MSALVRSGGRRHHIRRIYPDVYELSWQYEVKHGRLLGYRTMYRDTNRKGAERFAKKWGVKMPEEKP